MTQLRRVPLFADIKDEDNVCIEQAEEWRLARGEILVKAGDPADNFLRARFFARWRSVFATSKGSTRQQEKAGRARNYVGGPRA